MNSTEYYGFNLPEDDDYYNVNDFNNTTQKVEDELIFRLKVASGSYIGTGTSGADNAVLIPCDTSAQLLKLEINMAGCAIGNSTYSLDAVKDLVINLEELTSDYKRILSVNAGSINTKGYVYARIEKGGISIYSDDSDYAVQLQMNYYNSVNPENSRYYYKVYYCDYMEG